MCGRSRCSLEPEAVAEYVRKQAGCSKWVNKEGYHPSHNVGPGTRMPVLRKTRPAPSDGPARTHASSSQSAAHALPAAAATASSHAAGAPAHEVNSDLTLHTMRWGLVPSWTKATESPDFWKMFNARSEGVTARPVFSRLLKGNRCVVLLEGFYEWRQEHKVKQPYYIHLRDEALLCFAGLYDSWHEASTGEEMYTYTILTTDIAPRLRWLHNRMPVILRDEAACMQWLDGATDVASMCRPYDGDDLVWHEVTPKMNKASYKEADCATKLKAPKLEAFFRAPGSKVAAAKGLRTDGQDGHPASSAAASDGAPPSDRSSAAPPRCSEAAASQADVKVEVQNDTGVAGGTAQDAAQGGASVKEEEVGVKAEPEADAPQSPPAAEGPGPECEGPVNTDATGITKQAGDEEPVWTVAAAAQKRPALPASPSPTKRQKQTKASPRGPSGGTPKKGQASMHSFFKKG